MKYQIIYADPPWDYRDKRDLHDRMCGGATSHYTTMSLKNLKKVNVPKLADSNCILFMWATFPNLKEALELIDAWGFTYKTLGFSWIKTNKNNGRPFFGIGHYTKSNCEVCLIGVKGKPEIINNHISSVIISPRREHSRKPDEVREQIIKLCGDKNRVELFARQRFEGWDVIGFEAPREMQKRLRCGEDGKNKKYKNRET